MNTYFDKSIEDQILITINNQLKQSVWDEVNCKLVEVSLDNRITSNSNIFHCSYKLHIDEFIKEGMKWELFFQDRE